MLCNYYWDEEEEEEDKGNASSIEEDGGGGLSRWRVSKWGIILFCFVLSSNPSFHDSGQVDIQ